MNKELNKLIKDSISKEKSDKSKKRKEKVIKKTQECKIMDLLIKHNDKFNELDQSKLFYNSNSYVSVFQSKLKNIKKYLTKLNITEKNFKKHKVNHNVISKNRELYLYNAFKKLKTFEGVIED